MTVKNSIPDEILRFMRPCSAMVTFAKSVQNNGAAPANAGTDPSQQQQQQQQAPPDPWAGVDIDNLPEEMRTQIAGIKAQFATLQTEKANLTQQFEGAKNAARQFQSKADQAQALLARHNLDPNSQPPPQGNPIESKIEAKLKQDGFDDANAKAFAKLLRSSFEVLEPEVLGKVGTAFAPHLHNVGLMSVDRMLAQGMINPQLQGVLNIPEVATTVRGHLTNMIGQGIEVNDTTLESISMMAYGQHMAKNPKQTTQQQQPYNPFAGPTIQGGGRTPFAPPMSTSVPNLQTSNSPVAANQDTANAANHALSSMLRGITKKK